MSKLRYVLFIAIASITLAACDSSTGTRTKVADDLTSATAATATAATEKQPAGDRATTPGPPFTVTAVAQFDYPWALAFLPDGRMLVTEMGGSLRLYDPGTNTIGRIGGVPPVHHENQGGLGDVALHPDYADNHLVYISYVEAGEDGLLGGAVARARLVLDGDGGGALEDLEVIWRQVPKTTGAGHFGYRLLFAPDGSLFISSSERQKFTPAQDMDGNLGKIVRLDDDGSPAQGNPFADRGGIAAQVWTLGHRNALGLAFDAAGRLWEIEMGPMGGDEMNLIVKGENYGYPEVSNGNHYDGTPIPDHDTRPEFRAPVITWTPVISPSSLMIYDGELFPDWRGNGFISGLSSKSLVRIVFDGDTAREAERFGMGERIRGVRQGPDGALWLLEDGTRGAPGRLFKLTPDKS